MYWYVSANLNCCRCRLYQGRAWRGGGGVEEGGEPRVKGAGSVTGKREKERREEGFPKVAVIGKTAISHEKLQAETTSQRGGGGGGQGVQGTGCTRIPRISGFPSPRFVVRVFHSPSRVAYHHGYESHQTRPDWILLRKTITWNAQIQVLWCMLDTRRWIFISLSELECHSCQQCSKIVQTHSTSLTSGNNFDAI